MSPIELTAQIASKHTADRAQPRAFLLTLPYPVSANRYWRTVTNRKTGRALTFVSEEAKAFKTEAAWLAKQAGIRTPLSCLVALHITLIPRNSVCMDLDNALKVTIDALKGVAYEDDSQVYRIIAERAEPRSEAACEVLIEEFIPALPPLLLGAQQGSSERKYRFAGVNYDSLAVDYSQTSYSSSRRFNTSR